MVTLSGRRLIRTEAGQRTEQDLSDPEALAAYQDVFGIALDRLPPVPEPVTS